MSPQILTRFDLDKKICSSTEKKAIVLVSKPLVWRRSRYRSRRGLLPQLSFYGHAEDNVDLKMNLYFTYEARDILKSFTLFITIKVIVKLNLRNGDKFEIEF